MAENLIVYGALCVWWDSIDKVAFLDTGEVGTASIGPEGEISISIEKLPCCPHCKGVLFQIEETLWYSGAEKYEQDGHPGYRDFLTWLRGRCFKTRKEAEEAYERQKGQN